MTKENVKCLITKSFNCQTESSSSVWMYCEFINFLTRDYWQSQDISRHSPGIFLTVIVIMNIFISLASWMLSVRPALHCWCQLLYIVCRHLDISPHVSLTIHYNVQYLCNVLMSTLSPPAPGVQVSDVPGVHTAWPRLSGPGCRAKCQFWAERDSQSGPEPDHRHSDTRGYFTRDPENGEGEETIVIELNNNNADYNGQSEIMRQ